LARTLSSALNVDVYEMKLCPVVVPLLSVENIEIILGREGKKIGRRVDAVEMKLARPFTLVVSFSPLFGRVDR